jgi:hypothetical protein
MIKDMTTYEAAEKAYQKYLTELKELRAKHDLSWESIKFDFMERSRDISEMFIDGGERADATDLVRETDHYHKIRLFCNAEYSEQSIKIDWTEGTVSLFVEGSFTGKIPLDWYVIPLWDNKVTLSLSSRISTARRLHSDAEKKRKEEANELKALQKAKELLEAKGFTIQSKT